VLELPVHQTATGITLHVVAGELDTAATAACEMRRARLASAHATVELLEASQEARGHRIGGVRIAPQAKGRGQPIRASEFRDVRLGVRTHDPVSGR
jgi:hypothetical protein